ncbi:GNAT family N-acetyltransferase [Streptomyces agglomeratus]|uniref:GNAT family N-acetyltransferase n=1 Tax=Streptomyces agglomeratus TaxID=285458 RepID=A0A1E5P4R3_9ACTN|nr:GNAT family protein [Streptomyces agglomeratus]OEJ24536.1 GNAT family N-acetyltransferase [Streptomyces agglomeratus]OEJ41511.1 GNAT family N-acetyltransferase [Streptomyces agglomeratus]OEJ44110.1 GNAT family N-acetyltransferase [Streptomyces agglomeratus]OEJ54002.1 GNAT family N-acetyltransferase [Streptomyces agglomeratus]OEJ61375.1 GNAT family N-acetyltransferase [Streptomyces agglomeratus]
MSSAWYERPTLTGRFVRLEPLSADHAEGLFEALKDPSVWTWLSHEQPADAAGMRGIVEELLAKQEGGDSVAFAQIDVATGEVAGSTSYYEIEPAHRGIAIGSTWLGSRFHRTGINTEAKLLLLGRAFDALGARRVTWHTDHLNERSQRAIERLGARHEGVLRSHRTRPDGTVRDTVVYSMLADEWPAAREALTARLLRP